MSLKLYRRAVLILCLTVAVMITVSDFRFRFDQSHRLSTTSGSIEGTQTTHVQDIRGKRILVGIPSYDHSQFHYLEKILDNMRNICEAGALVSVNIYSTVPYSVETIRLLNSRTRCRNPVGELNMKVKLYPPSIKFRLVDMHRKDFYDNLTNFDLFIYTEDDHDIQTRHVVSYLSETEQLKQTVGIKEFPKYSIGFIRYEMSPENKRVTFDQYAFKNLGLTPFMNVENRATSVQQSPTPFPLQHPLRFKYVQNAIFPYQGMYMATSEQLKLWKNSCNFDQGIILNEDLSWHREYVANLRLFENFKFPDDNCHVLQVFPLNDSFEDFSIHHMADKYYARFKDSRPEYIRKNTMDPLSLQQWREMLLDGSSQVYNWNYDGLVTEIGDYAWKEGEPRPDMSSINEFEWRGD